MSYNRSDHPETHEMIGQRYQIVRQLREEPWGGVWLAQDNILRTEVSLKLLARDAPEWTAARDMFEHAAILGLKLRHPQILGIFHLDKAERFLYLVEEPFPGESLMAQWVQQDAVQPAAGAAPAGTPGPGPGFRPPAGGSPPVPQPPQYPAQGGRPPPGQFCLRPGLWRSAAASGAQGVCAAGGHSRGSAHAGRQCVFLGGPGFPAGGRQSALSPDL